MAKISRKALIAQRIMSEEGAKAEMKALTAAFEAALSAAEAHADIYGLSFGIEPSYGMGGRYVGITSPDLLDYIDEGEELEDEVDPEDDYDQNYGWQASSQSC